MGTTFTQVNLADVDDAAPRFGFGEIQEARFAMGDLDAEETGVAHFRLKPGRRSAFGHRHDEAEEVYVVLGGTGRMKLDDAIIDVRPLDAIRVSPPVMRAFEAGQDGLEVLAFGPHRDKDGEIVADWWSD
jgi:uncharacterized cupin superfamily protein